LYLSRPWLIEDFGRPLGPVRSALLPHRPGGSRFSKAASRISDEPGIRGGARSPSFPAAAAMISSYPAIMNATRGDGARTCGFAHRTSAPHEEREGSAGSSLDAVPTPAAAIQGRVRDETLNSGSSPSIEPQRHLVPHRIARSLPQLRLRRLLVRQTDPSRPRSRRLRPLRAPQPRNGWSSLCVSFPAPAKHKYIG